MEGNGEGVLNPESQRLEMALISELGGKAHAYPSAPKDAPCPKRPPPCIANGTLRVAGRKGMGGNKKYDPSNDAPRSAHTRFFGWAPLPPGSRRSASPCPIRGGCRLRGGTGRGGSWMRGGGRKKGGKGKGGGCTRASQRAIDRPVAAGWPGREIEKME